MTTQQREYRKPIPRPSETTRPYWEGAKAHEFRLQRCRDCGQYIFYPRRFCPDCLSDSLEWVRASGRGRIYTYTIVRRPGQSSFREDAPYILAIVELEEGPRLTTNIVEAGLDEVHIGMPVEAVFDDVTPEATIVKFRPIRR
jgi:uncharacterized OB-fold protein